MIHIIYLAKVASFTDAWIETNPEDDWMNITIVASFTDAWIETINVIGDAGFEPSHLLQMRGLKLVSLAPLEPVDGRIFYRCVD